MSDALTTEFQYFLAHRQELLTQFPGKFLVIKGQVVQDAYDTITEAIEGGGKKFAMGTFLVQECSENEQSFTRTFRSRVAFA